MTAKAPPKGRSTPLSKRPRLVSTVRRGSEEPLVAVTDAGKPVTPAKVTAARASRKAAMKPLYKAKPVDPASATPEVIREEPVIWKKDAGKPLTERLNPKLLEQLRTRKVTNRAAADALEVSETYLCRVLAELGVEKETGKTNEHRKSRSTLAQTRTQMREILAKKVNRNEMTIERAAKEANCSVRTMFRYCAKYTK